MKNVFVLVKQGVYDHGIYGIYTDQQEAVEAAKVAIKREKDDYHDVRVERVDLNSLDDLKAAGSQKGDVWLEDPAWAVVLRLRRDDKNGKITFMDENCLLMNEIDINEG